MANVTFARLPFVAAEDGLVRAQGWVPEAGRPYEALNADKSMFSAFTYAALIAAGHVVQRNEKAAPATGKGDFTLFKMIAGKTAPKEWKRLGRIDADGQLTVPGLNELEQRLQGNRKAYNTSLDKVKLILDAIHTGGTIEVKGVKVKFGAPVAHSVKAPAKAPAKAAAKAAKPTSAKAKGGKTSKKTPVLITPAPKA
jgi:hypothetical protein